MGTVFALPHSHYAEHVDEMGLTAFLISPAPDSILATLYDALQADGTLVLIHYEYLPTKEEFIRWMQSPHTRYAIGMMSSDRDPDTVEIAGAGIIWDIGKIGAVLVGEVGQVFRRKFQVGGLPAILSRKMLDYAFNDLGFDILSGVTPVCNRPAMRFLHEIGFKRVHTVEKLRKVQGRPTDCLVSYMSAKDWVERRAA